MFLSQTRLDFLRDPNVPVSWDHVHQATIQFPNLSGILFVEKWLNFMLLRALRSTAICLECERGTIILFW